MFRSIVDIILNIPSGSFSLPSRHLDTMSLVSSTIGNTTWDNFMDMAYLPGIGTEASHDDFFDEGSHTRGSFSSGSVQGEAVEDDAFFATGLAETEVGQEMLYKKSRIKKMATKRVVRKSKAPPAPRVRPPIVYTGKKKVEVMERNRLSAEKSRYKKNVTITNLEILVYKYETDLEAKTQEITELRAALAMQMHL
jgi:hypothetical protein